MPNCIRNTAFFLADLRFVNWAAKKFIDLLFADYFDLHRLSKNNSLLDGINLSYALG
jgi:hypothetical protein